MVRRAAVPPQEPGSPYYRLRRIVEFVRDSVRWAEIRDGSYMALEAGSRDGAWLAVVPPGHESLAYMRGAYMIESSPSITALLIRPVPVTEPWAEWAPADLADLTARVETLSPRARASLDAAMPGGEPASPSERALRDGFYYLAIHLRFTDGREDGAGEMLETLARLYPGSS